MNSLNILSARVSPPQSPSSSRKGSYASVLHIPSPTESKRNSRGDVSKSDEKTERDHPDEINEAKVEGDVIDEKTSLLGKSDSTPAVTKASGWTSFPKRITNALLESIRWVLSTIAAPGVYLVACLYDQDGRFAPIGLSRKRTKAPESTKEGLRNKQTLSPENKRRSAIIKGARTSSVTRRSSARESKKAPASYSSTSGLSSDSESDVDRSAIVRDEKSSTSTHHTRSRSLQSSDEIAPSRRYIRIKLHNDETLRQRKHSKSQSPSSQSNGSGAVSQSTASEVSPATLNALKSPTSPASASLLLTKYPRAPAPPRPLIPPRQPSYSVADGSNGKMAQKTLILDLDETLIHSMAKGGRMSTGHMVEVKLNTYVGVGGQPAVGPQHPILYYVHKRPYCDDFLRRVCKWYNLVVFTASVQEYADPVIDWLEQERKFFSGRYYRQHCTYRHGAFIKDLSSVEPDLSKVMILDNSPLSYMFHQDNAIPIEGWISDPTDNDLLHLVPLLEGLQYVTDVRALLALRGGEDGRHQA